MVTDTPEQSLAAFGEKILATVRETNPARVVLDVRLNRGGNHDLRFPFVASLVRAEDADTKLFVLVGRGAFSATQALLDDLDRYTQATFIGEPAASKPNSYGDSYKLALPNSGVTFRTSILWHQIDNGARPWTPIDHAAPPTFADYAAGRDAALETALTLGDVLPLATRLVAVARGELPGHVLPLVQAYLDDPTTRYADRTRALLRSAGALTNAGFAKDGLAVAEAGVAYDAASVDAWATLALLAQKAGDAERAMAAAKETVRLDPNNRNVRGILGT